MEVALDKPPFFLPKSRERKMVPCEQPVLNKQNYAANARLDHKLLSAPSARSCKYRILLLLRSNVGHRSAAGSQRPSNQDLANSAIQTVAGGFQHVSGALLKGSGVCWNAAVPLEADLSENPPPRQQQAANARVTKI